MHPPQELCAMPLLPCARDGKSKFGVRPASGWWVGLGRKASFKIAVCSRELNAPHRAARAAAAHCKCWWCGSINADQLWMTLCLVDRVCQGCKCLSSVASQAYRNCKYRKLTCNLVDVKPVAIAAAVWQSHACWLVEGLEGSAACLSVFMRFWLMRFSWHSVVCE